jgi:hypothetical protein
VILAEADVQSSNLTIGVTDKDRPHHGQPQHYD